MWVELAVLSKQIIFFNELDFALYFLFLFLLHCPAEKFFYWFADIRWVLVNYTNGKQSGGPVALLVTSYCWKF